MAGTAHAGSQIGAELDEILARDGVGALLQRDVVNTIDWSWVRNAALEYLVRWAEGGEAPSSFRPVDASLAGGIHADDAGNATGGIRLPDLEVPTARHSGTNDVNPLAALSGQTIPWDSCWTPTATCYGIGAEDRRRAMAVTEAFNARGYTHHHGSSSIAVGTGHRPDNHATRWRTSFVRCTRSGTVANSTGNSHAT
jgi:hypothetical protein